MNYFSILAVIGIAMTAAVADPAPGESALGPLKDLDGYFPWSPSSTRVAWSDRSTIVRRQMQVSLGLHPWPTKTPLNAIVHGLIERDDYTVEKVYFESMPGFYVTGSLFRPKGKGTGRPAVLCPHGHWTDGRFNVLSDAELKQEIERGGERLEHGGRSLFQSLGVQLARMGCVALVVDMIGYADSQQLSFDLAHKFSKQRPEMISGEPGQWGFYSPQAESHGQSIMGLQTWNNIRALDFLSSLPDVDPSRLGCTGGSGGGTQTMILGALDSRLSVAFPAVMVSTAMQGGCTCENACGLRIGTGNIEFAALFAPRPMAMTSAKDWTIDLPTKGFPDLKKHWAMLNAPGAVQLFAHPEFGHNYNIVTREHIYAWFNEHFQLGLASDRLKEREYEPLSRDQLTVWDAAHPAPPAGPDLEKKLIRWWYEDARKQMEKDIPTFRQIAREGLQTLTFSNDSTHAAADQSAAKTLVIWLSSDGESGLQGGGAFAPHAERLRGKGFTVRGVDLLLQGKDNPTPSVPNPREFAGYTYGYNPSLFTRRVNQVRQLISSVARRGEARNRVALVAVEKSTAAIAAMAAALEDHIVDAIVLDPSGFRFQGVKDIRDPLFFPGGARFGDLPGIVALGAPRPLYLMEDSEIESGIIGAAYETAGVPDTLRITSSHNLDNAVTWLIEQLAIPAHTTPPEGSTR